MLINEISFGGVLSSEFGLTVGTETHFILPTLRASTQEVLGRDGLIDFGIGGYGVRVITLPIYFDGDYAELRANTDRIAAWLATRKEPKKLMLGWEPDRYYLARVYSGLEFGVTSNRHVGDIVFECNPPWKFLLDGTELTPEQLTFVNCGTDTNQYIMEFTSSGTMRLVNRGSMTVKPVIKLYGYIKSGLTLTCGADTFTFSRDCLFDGIAVDCKNETVSRMSDGVNMTEYISTDSEFLSLPPGNVEIDIAQPSIGEWERSVFMIVEFEAMEGIDNV